jgi:Gpi18-like mannosyltransferase
VYLALFPTSFFLIAAYTESLFIFLAIASLVLARRGRFGTAGGLAFLATLTRTTGVGLILPFGYLALRHIQAHPRQRRHIAALLAALLPGVAFGLFLLLRAGAGLPPIAGVYAQEWHQTTTFPGSDLLTALQIIVSGEGIRAGEITLVVDFLVALALVAVTALSFRRLGTGHGLYCLVLLLFVFLPRSDLKPLYSFSRYALAFYPGFFLLALAGRNPVVHRLVLYPGLLLLLYLSGQFFIWGWVA